jgi:glyoxylase-like metal-dependent hydrolase (beta-lactamase superfamily II)
MTDDDTNLHWDIGTVAVTRVEEALVELDATALMPDFTPNLLDQHPWVVPNYFSNEGLLRLSIHSFVVVSEGVTIVVDTCVGTEGDRPLPSDESFIDRLAAVVDGGLEGVDVVLCTHLHFDHVGWNTRRVDDQLVPTFPNARYLFAKAELDHLEIEDHMAVREPSVQPLLDAGLVDAVDGNHQITGEVQLLPTPGHTPGHVSVQIESNGVRALITGDAFHTPLQVAVPDLPAAAFDWDSTMSTSTRVDLLAHLEGTDTLMLGTHFAPPTAGHIVEVNQGLRLD